MAGDRKYRKDKEIISEFDSHTKGKAIFRFRSTVDPIPNATGGKKILDDPKGPLNDSTMSWIN